MDTILLEGQFDIKKGKGNYIGGMVLCIIGFFLLIGGAVYAILDKKIFLLFPFVLFAVFIICGSFSTAVGGLRTLNQKIALTDNCVMCNSHDGATVNLQYEKIISINKNDAMKMIVINTGAAKPISFLNLLNYNEIFEFINKKISEISNEKTSVNSIGAADELKKYKDLLDAGIITQEEFDAKKKQLLGL